MRERAILSGSEITKGVLFGAVALALFACSGAGQSDLYDPTGTSQFGTDPTNGNGNTNGSSSSSSGSGSSSGGSSNSGGGSTGGGSTGGSGGDTGGGSGGGGGGGGGTDAGGGTVDSGGGGGGTNSSGIYCGYNASSQAVMCDTKTQECCGTRMNGSPNESFACIPNGGACPGTPIHCDDDSDCGGGQVCCGFFDQSKGYTSLECKASCTSPSGDITALHMCDPAAPVDECASKGQTCMASQSLTGFYFCN